MVCAPPKNPFAALFDAPQSLSQAINPWSWWFETVANMNATASDNVNGLINITTYKSSDVDMERRITHEVAGYGSQLKTIENLIEAMLEPLGDFAKTPKQKEALIEFKDMMARISAEKEKQALEQLSPGGVERFIDNLETLKTKDSALYKKVVSRLKEAL
ncbi:MAG: hypothetical protein KTR28_02250 [Micavibrio sp.]|nr:hypothetical protein [Micavibrio sp.]